MNDESQCEIRSQFSEGFLGEKSTNMLRTAKLTAFEWNFLMKGRHELKQRRQLIKARISLAAAGEQIALNLDDSMIFMPLFQELLDTVAFLRFMPEPSLQTLSESGIVLVLANLRDLCFVILEFIKNDEARQVIRYVSELLYKWKTKLSSITFETRPENKIGLRTKLRHMYFSAIKDESPPLLM